MFKSSKLVRKSDGDINKIGKYEVLPQANIVPFDELATKVLANSIKRDGQEFPIILYKGKILDGRQRTYACLTLGIEPKAIDIGIDRDYTEEELERKSLLYNTRRNLSDTKRIFSCVKAVLSNKHKKVGYTDAKKYAKEVWEVSAKQLTYGKWIFRNYKKYALSMLNNGEVTIDKKKFKAVTPLYEFLKKQEELQRQQESSSGSEHYNMLYQSTLMQMKLLFSSGYKPHSLEELTSAFEKGVINAYKESGIDIEWLDSLIDYNSKTKRAYEHIMKERRQK